MGSKIKPLKADQGPAPNEAAPTPLDIYKRRAPKYPIAMQLKDLARDRVPGPSVYDADVSKMKLMKQSPAYSHRWRTADPLADKDKKPGPAAYDLMSYNPFEKSAGYTMRRRLTEFRHVPIVPMDNC